MNRALDEGYSALCIEDEYLPWTPVAELVERCRLAQLPLGIWESAPDWGSAARHLDSGNYSFIAQQVEGPGQLDRVLGSISSLLERHPATPRAIVTNGGGFEHQDGTPAPEKAAPLIAARYACIAEGHKCEDPNRVDPRARARWIEQKLGWPYVSPMIGLGKGCTFADYPGIELEPDWSVYGADELWQ